MVPVEVATVVVVVVLVEGAVFVVVVVVLVEVAIVVVVVIGIADIPEAVIGIVDSPEVILLNANIPRKTDDDIRSETNFMGDKIILLFCTGRVRVERFRRMTDDHG